MKAYIKAIEYYLPEEILTNEMLAAEFPEWTLDKIQAKTGIEQRHVASAAETSMDLGVKAAQKLFTMYDCTPEQIDFILFCTQSPDYYLPTSACIIQTRLGIPRTCGALDINLGCSGFVYGLGLAKGLIETGQANNVLLITGETYSKFIHPGDKSVRTLFGDAAAATLIQAVESSENGIGPFIYGTDGDGSNNLIVPTGGARNPRTQETSCVVKDENDNLRSADNLYMNGSEIFTFTLNTIPKTVSDILTLSGINIDNIDHFVFHQANKFMLDHLRKRIKIPEEKFIISFSHCGNTVSSTIPIAIYDAVKTGRIKAGDIILVVGFGVGYSWGAALLRWK